MNAKQIFAAATLAVIGASAMASEATNFALETGTLTRAEVKAELARAQAAGESSRVAVYGSFPAASVASQHAADAQRIGRSRDEVRVEARAAARRADFNDLYVGG